MKRYDKIIIGAGLYGLYATNFAGKQNDTVLVLECDEGPFKRATYINQARVHKGYHYPRSFSTASLSRNYFERFSKDYSFCIKKDFLKIYAISEDYSWTDNIQFQKFCHSADIKCSQLSDKQYFKEGSCSGIFETEEYTYDANILCNYLLNEISTLKNVTIKYSANIIDIKRSDELFVIKLENGEEFETEFLLNATYASVNQVSAILGFEMLKIKYEICEIILCEVSDNIKDVGITVMDGPFFSIMPFGKTGLHSLTSVTFTPHVTSYNSLPTFNCQSLCEKDFCSPSKLGNCNYCTAKPKSAFSYMYNLAKKYLNDDIEIKYHSSLFSMKPILQASEIDDSRPTIIRRYCESPTFISVLSGKINTVYDLDEILIKKDKN